MKAACWLVLITILAQSCSHLESRTDEDFTTGRNISGELEYSSQEDLEQLKSTMLRQTSNSSASENGTVTATRQGPCQCGGGLCGCCSRILYSAWRQKACVNITYDPDEFSFTANIIMNDRVLYTRTVSGERIHTKNRSIIN